MGRRNDKNRMTRFDIGPREEMGLILTFQELRYPSRLCCEPLKQRVILVIANSILSQSVKLTRLIAVPQLSDGIKREARYLTSSGPLIGRMIWKNYESRFQLALQIKTVTDDERLR